MSLGKRLQSLVQQPQRLDGQSGCQKPSVSLYTNLLDNESAYIMANEYQRSCRVIFSILHEQAEETVGMFGEVRVLVVDRKTVVVGEEHHATLFVEAAGKNVSWPDFAPVGPSVSVNKIASFNIETVNGDDTKQGTKNERVSGIKRSDQRWESTSASPDCGRWVAS